VFLADEGCYFGVRFPDDGGFNCEASANSAGSASACSESFVEEPQGSGPIMGGGGFKLQFHCDRGAVVTTINDLLWIPERCYPAIDDE